MIGGGRSKAPAAPNENASDHGRDSTRPRGRGRPPRLSRDRIVEGVLAILDRESEQVPTIASIAREVEAVPAALYRHFESLDEIMDGVLTRVLETSQSGLEASEPWQRQLSGWMRRLRDHLLRYPAVLSMIGRSGRTSPAWLEASSALVVILERAGLSGHDLAVTYLWVLETTVGLIMQEAAQSLPEQLANARASRKELGEAARARFASIAHEIDRIDGDEFFSFAVEQATANVELRVMLSRRD